MRSVSWVRWHAEGDTGVEEEDLAWLELGTLQTGDEGDREEGKGRDKREQSEWHRYVPEEVQIQVSAAWR